MEWIKEIFLAFGAFLLIVMAVYTLVRVASAAYFKSLKESKEK